VTRDLRQYAKRTDIQLIAGFILLLFLVGEGLIWFFYGREGAILGLFCTVAGIAPIVLIWLLLSLAEKLVKRASHE
jgi:hypothetical protein